MTTSAKSVGTLVAMVGGLLVWAGHFGLLYGVQAAVCTVAPGSATAVRIAGAVLTLLALGAVICLVGWRRSRAHADPAPASGEAAAFIDFGTAACAGVAVLAMLWSTLPLLMLPACLPAAV